MEEQQEGGAAGFEEIGVEPRLVRAIAKRGVTTPTLVQQKGIPLILEGKDVVARAKTGSGKTLAYLLPLVQKLLGAGLAASGPSSLILVPTRELCQQVYDELMLLLRYCGEELRAEQLTASMSALSLKSALCRRPNVLVSTPGCISSCINDNLLSAASLEKCLSYLVLDEADLLLSYGYEEDLQKLAACIPRRCQCLLMSATTSDDVEKLKKLVLHNPVTLTLREEGPSETIVPSTVQQYKINCSSEDKLLYLLTLMRFGLIQKKALIFVNAIDTSFRVKLFLEQFGIKSAVLNGELPQNSRLHILKEFNIGLFDYMIATDDGKLDKVKEATEKKSKKRLRKKLMDAEFGVVRGIDFKNVSTVVNFDMPRTASGYVHRIGRTGRAGQSGVALSFVHEKDEALLCSIEDLLSVDKEPTDNAGCILPFPTSVEQAVSKLRYRAEDAARSVTKIAIREARAKELKLEIMNSERLKGHFEDNPADLELLKHDKILSKQTPAHLRSVPDYIRDSVVEAAGKIIKSQTPAAPTMRYIKRRTRNWEDDPVKAIGSQKKRSHESKLVPRRPSKTRRK